MFLAAFLHPWKLYVLPAQLQLWPQATSFSHYIAYLFVTISFIVSLTTNSTVGERNPWLSYLFQYDGWKCAEEESQQEERTSSLSLFWCCYFKTHFTRFCFVLCFNSASECLQDLQCVGIKEITVFKLRMRVQNLIYLRIMFYFSIDLGYGL